MKLVLPPPAALDWHLVLHLTLYPEWSRLSSRTYCLNKRALEPSRDLFTPRILERPATEWDAVQSLELGLDLLSRRLWPHEE